MSQYSVIGFKHQDITFKDGRTVSGYNLALTQPRDGYNGFAAETLFVSDSKIGDYKPQLHDAIDIIWNRWGKVDGIRKIK